MYYKPGIIITLFINSLKSHHGPCRAHNSMATEMVQSHQQTNQQNTQIRSRSPIHYTLDVTNPNLISWITNRFNRRSRQKHLQTKCIQVGRSRDPSGLKKRRGFSVKGWKYFGRTDNIYSYECFALINSLSCVFE